MENERLNKDRKAGEDMEWTDYHRVETIYEWLDLIKTQFPNFITVETIGESYERRPMKLVKLSKKQVLEIKF